MSQCKTMMRRLLLNCLVFGCSFAFGKVACEPSTLRREVQYSGYRPNVVEIMRQCSALQNEAPYFVFVTYLALVDRDYYTGWNPEDSRTADRYSNDFLFAALARELVGNGFDVVKYDPLAVHEESGKSSTGIATTAPDATELARIRRKDFAGLLSSVIKIADGVLDSKRAGRPIVLVAHSGGSFTVGDYLMKLGDRKGGKRRYGFLGISPSLSSATGDERTRHKFWMELIDRCLQQNNFLECGEAALSNKYFTMLFSGPEREQIAKILRAPAEVATALGDLDTYLATLVQASDQLHANAPRGGQSMLNEKYAISNELFYAMRNRLASARSISCAVASAAIFFGQDDVLLSAASEAQAWVDGCGRASDIAVLQEVGHVLGADSYIGPIDEKSLLAVTAGAIRVAKEVVRH